MKRLDQKENIPQYHNKMEDCHYCETIKKAIQTFFKDSQQYIDLQILLRYKYKMKMCFWITSMIKYNNTS